MHGATGVGAGFDELGLALPPPAFGIVGRDDIGGVGAIGRHIAFGVEQIALAVALQHRAEIPAMAMIIGELRIAQLAVEAVDIAQEFDIAPQTTRGSSLGIAVVNFAHFARRRIMLRPIDALIILVAHPRRTRRDILRPRPHRRRVGFIIPHRVAEVAVQKDVRLMHVAVHALRGRNGAGEGVADRVATLAPAGTTGRDQCAMAGTAAMGFIAGSHCRDLCRRGRGRMAWCRRMVVAAMLVIMGARLVHQLVDRRIDRLRLAIATEWRIDARMARLAVVGINHMAARAAR